MNFNDVIKEISFETFQDVMAVSPRKVREALYAHYGVKPKGSSLLSALKDKKTQKVKSLHSALKEAHSPKELEFVKELFRNWLFHQRPLLKATLDFLNVKNDNGLVETELDFFTKLTPTEVKNLVGHVKPNFAKDAILIYFTFVEVPEFKKYL